MTENYRIFLNIVATYGRSLYALVVGLFCGRWALMALGEVDYGLVGLVGGLTGFVSLLNGLLSMSVMRFYAVSVGAANKSGNEVAGLEECRKWFNTALLIHLVVPVVLVAIGYPVGVWAVEKFLAIPADRVGLCVWVWRFTCFSCFIGMVNVPFAAMYTAKQEIAELTIYGFSVTTANALSLYYMITHPGVWIAKYAFIQCLYAVLPAMIILVRAVIKYPECRFCPQYLWSLERIKQIAIFSGARFWGAFTNMTATQGRSILVNKFLGPALNASIGVGNTVASHASTLSASISGAFWPAIANKAGEGDIEGVKSLMFRTCRISSVMVIVFVVPLLLEAHEVLQLWLKNPPAYAAEICMASLLVLVMSRTCEGYWMAVMGVGKRVPYYSFIIGWTEVVGLAVAWTMFLAGCGIWSVVASLLVAQFLIVVFRVFLGWQIVGISIKQWLKCVWMPVCLLMALGLVAGIPSRFLLQADFVRVVITTVCCELVIMPVAWFFLLDAAEKQVLCEKLRKLFNKFR